MIKFFTIGYDGRSPEDFIQALTQNGIKIIADVRLNPDQESMEMYSKTGSSDKGIERLLADVSIKYVSLPELGNIFSWSHCWKRKYRQLINETGHLLVDRLYDLGLPFALLCSERDVSDCHRKIIADFLVDLGGFEVEHIP